MTDAMMATPEAAARGPRRLVDFQVTRQHRRFCEFADAVRRCRYIGLCYGAPGLGKTLSARTYAAADDWDRWWHHDRYYRQAALPATLLESRTAFYTPEVQVTGRQLSLEVYWYVHWLSDDIYRATGGAPLPQEQDVEELPMCTELVIVDEADRANAAGLEQLRDLFDRSGIGMILIGMPGFERRLARYPQLYSRIGFAHRYLPIDTEDMPAVLSTYWQHLGYDYRPDGDDAEATAAITSVTGGNFRLIERLMTQIARVIDINHLDRVTPDVVHAARKALVIGTT